MTVSRKASAMEIPIFFYRIVFINLKTVLNWPVLWFVKIFVAGRMLVLLSIVLDLYIADCCAKVRSWAKSSLFSKKGTPLTSSIHAHCKCLKGFTGFPRFFLQYLWKRAVRITKKPYTPQRERLRILWRNPVIFTDCGETPW